MAFNVGYQQNQREEFGNPDSLDERALFFDLKTATYTAKLLVHEMNGWKTTIGLNGMNQQNINKGVEQLIPDYTLNDIGGFIYSDKTFDKITFSGGLRFDNRSINASKLRDGEEVKGPAFNSTFLKPFNSFIGLDILPITSRIYNCTVSMPSILPVLVTVTEAVIV